MASSRGRWGLGLGVALVVACAGPPALWCGPPWLAHDLYAARLRREAAGAAGPLGGVTTASRGAFGILWGNSNHCDWEAWARVETDVPWSGADRAGLSAMGMPFVWDATDPEHLVYVAHDGERLPHVDACAACFEGGLEARAEAELFALARSPRRTPGGYVYVVQLVAQSYDRWDLRDPRCH